MSAITVTRDNFADAVLGASATRPVLVDFWAPWCAPCRALAPVLDRLAGEHEGRFTLAKLNTEEAQDIAAQLRIQSIPTLALFHGGREIARRAGALDLRSLTQWVEAQLGAIA